MIFARKREKDRATIAVVGKISVTRSYKAFHRTWLLKSMLKRNDKFFGVPGCCYATL